MMRHERRAELTFGCLPVSIVRRAFWALARSGSLERARRRVMTA
jgi:hypothetical protein